METSGLLLQGLILAIFMDGVHGFNMSIECKRHAGYENESSSRKCLCFPNDLNAVLVAFCLSVRS